MDKKKLQNIKYGLAGCGMMGQEHVQNVRLLDGAEIAAVYDPEPALADEAAAKAGGAAIAPSFAELIARPDLDALIVASPNDCHVDQLAQLAETRPLPLMMEKPLYTTRQDAARVAGIAASYPAPVWVAMEYRYMPPIAALVAEAQAATGGVRMLAIREHRFPFLPKVGNWNRFNARSGGTLVEKCCHFFDLMRLILDDEPVRVMASAGQDVNHFDESYDGRVPDVWDNAYVIVDFARGGRAMLDLCMFAEGGRWQEEIAATGPEGKIEAFVPGPTRFWPEGKPAPVARLVRSPRAPKDPVDSEVPVDPALLAAGDHNGATFYQHQRFAQVVRGEASPDVTLADGAAAVDIALAAQQAAAEGRVVTL